MSNGPSIRGGGTTEESDDATVEDDSATQEDPTVVDAPTGRTDARTPTQQDSGASPQTDLVATSDGQTTTAPEEDDTQTSGGMTESPVDTTGDTTGPGTPTVEQEPESSGLSGTVGGPDTQQTDTVSALQTRADATQESPFAQFQGAEVTAGGSVKERARDIEQDVIDRYSFVESVQDVAVTINEDGTVSVEFTESGAQKAAERQLEDQYGVDFTREDYTFDTSGDLELTESGREKIGAVARTETFASGPLDVGPSQVFTAADFGLGPAGAGDRGVTYEAPDETAVSTAAVPEPGEAIGTVETQPREQAGEPTVGELVAGELFDRDVDVEMAGGTPGLEQDAAPLLGPESASVFSRQRFQGTGSEREFTVLDRLFLGIGQSARALESRAARGVAFDYQRGAFASQFTEQDVTEGEPTSVTVRTPRTEEEFLDPEIESEDITFQRGAFASQYTDQDVREGPDRPVEDIVNEALPTDIENVVQTTQDVATEFVLPGQQFERFDTREEGVRQAGRSPFAFAPISTTGVPLLFGSAGATAPPAAGGGAGAAGGGGTVGGLAYANARAGLLGARAVEGGAAALGGGLVGSAAQEVELGNLIGGSGLPARESEVPAEEPQAREPELPAARPAAREAEVPAEEPGFTEATTTDELFPTEVEPTESPFETADPTEVTLTPVGEQRERRRFPSRERLERQRRFADVERRRSKSVSERQRRRQMKEKAERQEVLVDEEGPNRLLRREFPTGRGAVVGLPTESELAQEAAQQELQEQSQFEMMELAQLERARAAEDEALRPILLQRERELSLSERQLQRPAVRQRERESPLSPEFGFEFASPAVTDEPTTPEFGFGGSTVTEIPPGFGPPLTPTPPTPPRRFDVGGDDDGEEDEELPFLTGAAEEFTFDFIDPLTGEVLRTDSE